MAPLFLCLTSPCESPSRIIKNVTFGLGECVTTGLLCEHHIQGSPEGTTQELPRWQPETEWEMVSGPCAVLMVAVPWLWGRAPHRATEFDSAGAGGGVCRSALDPHPTWEGQRQRSLTSRTAPFSPVLMSPHCGGRTVDRWSVRSAGPMWGWVQAGVYITVPSSDPTAVVPVVYHDSEA